MTLTELGCKYGTDKAYHHGFTDHYEHMLTALKSVSGAMLEMGVEHGASLYMWQDWLPQLQVHAVDIMDRTMLSEPGKIQVHQASQTDVQLLQQLSQQHGPWWLVVDDGSHYCAHQWLSFRILWPHVRPGGFYIIEDTHCNAWPEFRCTGADMVFRSWAADATCWPADAKHVQVITGRHGPAHSEAVVVHKS